MTRHITFFAFKAEDFRKLDRRPPMTSETARYTPGPWRIEGLVKRGDENGKLISHGLNHYGDGPAGYVGSFFGSFEDAALVVASPDLLKAAKRALSTFRAQGVHRDGTNVVAALEDAIALTQSKGA